MAELAARLDDRARGGRAGDQPRATATSCSTARPVYSLGSVDLFEDMVGRADELGFTDVITHWPRPEGVYAGDVRVLEGAASRVLTARPAPL